VIVDRHVQVLPAGSALRLARAIAGDAVSWPDDAAELLDVDVHELAGRGALVADDLLAASTHDQARATVPAEHRVHGRGSDPERPTDHVRSFAKLLSGAQDRLLDDLGRTPGRAVRPARAVVKRLTSTSAVDPLRGRLP